MLFIFVDAFAQHTIKIILRHSTLLRVPTIATRRHSYAISSMDKADFLLLYAKHFARIKNYCQVKGISYEKKLQLMTMNLLLMTDVNTFDRFLSEIALIYTHLSPLVASLFADMPTLSTLLRQS